MNDTLSVCIYSFAIPRLCSSRTPALGLRRLAPTAVHAGTVEGVPSNLADFGSGTDSVKALCKVDTFFCFLARTIFQRSGLKWQRRQSGRAIRRGRRWL
jgi:hypothetical protein